MIAVDQVRRITKKIFAKWFSLIKAELFLFSKNVGNVVFIFVDGVAIRFSAYEKIAFCNKDVPKKNVCSAFTLYMVFARKLS